jgi:abortive infection bacteriophage resistance protein
MLTQFDIPPMQFIGFTNLIENIINIRNLISHNIVVYNATIKYQSKALNDFYNFLFQQEIKTFALPHLIKCIGKLVNNEKLYIKTIDGINKTEISEQHKQMILKLFII